MGKYRHNRPTIGVLPGWQAYVGTLDSFLGQVLHGIQMAAHDHACNLLMACGIGSNPDVSYGRPAWPIQDPEVDFMPVGQWNTDGLIVVPPLSVQITIDTIDSVRACHFPLVYAGDRESGPSVIVDNLGGVHQAIFHLYEHGHRQIAFISGRNPEMEGDSRLRLRGYLSALQEFGLDVHPDLIAQGFHTHAGGYQAVREILNRGVHFTAIMASNDQSALGAMDALRDGGLLIPQDVAVIGFDDRLEGRAMEPSLTTVHFPMFELGYQSVDLLLKQIEEGVQDSALVQIPTRLVMRESCGCLAGSTSRIPAEIGTGERFSKNIESSDNPVNPPVSRANHGGEAAIRRPSTLQITQAMTSLVFNDLQRLSLKEVTSLCQRMAEAFKASLTYGDATIFRLTTQQVLERVASAGDDLFAWQSALSVLRAEQEVPEHIGELMEVPPSALNRQQVEDMLHQARVIVSEVSRGQYSRILLRQMNWANQFGQLTARFFTVRDEAELFEMLARELPAVGIRTTAIAFYEPDGPDETGWSVLQTTDVSGQHNRRFPSRAFPPPGLYPEEQPFNLVLLLLLGLGDIKGYIAYETDDLDMCALMTRQIVGALWGIRLYRQAVEASHLAEERRQAAEEANHLKSRFLSMVSHELRTPLNLISGLSDMLLRGSKPQDIQDVIVGRQDLERIYISAQYLDGLIRDVLDLASSDIGQLKLVREPLDIGEVLSAVSIIGEQLAKDKSLYWRYEIADNIPRVWGDRVRLRQVILNLVNNAVKFTAHGSVALTALYENKQVVISVSDTGLGIAPGEHELIFNEFRQSERTAARGYGGLGLGLAICKRLVEMHDGQISVCSTGEEGLGSNFVVVLPTMDPNPQPSRNILPLSEVHRVLLLLKDSANNELLKGILTGYGYHVVTSQVDDSSDWVASLLFAMPDAVIMDLGITSERGWEILKTLNENPSTQGLPVLFYSVSSGSDCGSFLEMNYLTKPLSAETLSEVLVSQGLMSNPGGQGKSKTILVVDDEPEMLEFHARLLEAQSQGHKVMRAQNGRQAMAMMRQERPALVLLDLMMPEMDGFAVLDSMRDENLIPGIPVIVVTGQVLTAEDMVRLNQGVTSVLEKGIYTKQETLEHITDALAHKRRPGSETQQIVLKAIAYIHAHYPEPISRSDVAAHIGFSERHLTRCFHQELGMTPITYLNRYRVRQAKLLLESGDKGITEIAIDVGFSSNAYFSRVFHDEVGLSPRAYLRSKCQSPEESKSEIVP